MKKLLCLGLCFLLLISTLAGCYRIGLRSGPYHATKAEAYLYDPLDDVSSITGKSFEYDKIRAEIGFIEANEKYGLYLAVVGADGEADQLLVCGMDVKKGQYRIAMDLETYDLAELKAPPFSREEWQKEYTKYYMKYKQNFCFLLCPSDWLSEEERTADAAKGVSFADYDIPYNGETLKITVMYVIENL